MNAFRFLTPGAAVAVLAIATTSATFAAGNASSEARQRYQQERAYCMSGQSQQDRATCLREAGAAYAQARKGDLATTGSTNFQANALARCEAQPVADREACKLRIMQGTTQGSVRDGGLIREVEVPVKQ